MAAVVSGSFDFNGFATGTGTAGILVADDLFQLYVNLDFNIGVEGIDLDFEVEGMMEVSDRGLYLEVGVALDANLTSLLEIDVDGDLLIDTRGANDRFILDLSGDLTIARILTVNGGLTIDVGAGGANTWRVDMGISGDLGPIGVRGDAWIQSDGQFYVDLEGGLYFGIDGFSIEGQVNGVVSLTKSGTNYVYKDTDSYTLKAEVGVVTLTIIGIGIGASNSGRRSEIHAV